MTYDFNDDNNAFSDEYSSATRSSHDDDDGPPPPQLGIGRRSNSDTSNLAQLSTGSGLNMEVYAPTTLVRSGNTPTTIQPDYAQNGV